MFINPTVAAGNQSSANVRVLIFTALYTFIAIATVAAQVLA